MYEYIIGINVYYNHFLKIKNQVVILLPRIVGFGSVFIKSALMEGLLPLEVSVEAPEEIGFSDTHSETGPSTVTKIL